MKRYIDKSALVAEIERRMKLRQDGYRKYNDVCDFIAFEELEYLHDEFLPTLEVKEMNLEEKEMNLDYIKKVLDEAVRIYKPNGHFGWGTLYNVATHFFELGMKTSLREEDDGKNT